MINSNKQYYTYIYCDPRKPIPYKIKGIDVILPAEPFYVGRGQKYRKNNHIYESLSGKKYNYKNNKINKIIKETGAPPIIMTISYHDSEEEVNIHERYLIKAIGRHDLKKGPLTNLTDGGEGIRNPSKSIRDKMSKRMIGNTFSKGRGGNKNTFYGKTHSDKSKEKIRKSSSERGISENCRKAQIETNSKAVVRLDLNYNYIDEFSSSKDASRKLRINPSSIVACCNFNYITGLSYFWIWKEKYIQLGIDKIKEIHQNKKICSMDKNMKGVRVGVAKLTKNGQFIKLYNTLDEAKKDGGKGCITSCVSCRTVTAGGFIYVYRREWVKFASGIHDNDVQKKIDYLNSGLYRKINRYEPA